MGLFNFLKKKNKNRVLAGKDKKERDQIYKPLILDRLSNEAAMVIFETQQASVSIVQRKLKIAYFKAAHIMDSLEEKGIVSSLVGSEPRKILISKDQYLKRVKIVEYTAESEKNSSSMKRKTSRLLSVPLALCIALALLPNAALAADSGYVALKPTNEVRWIDRVELPDYALTLYETLEAAIDGDGYNDYLIDDEYFDLKREDVPSNGQPGDFIRGNVTREDGSVFRYTGIVVTTTENDERDHDTISNCIDAVYVAFERDHPEAFWLNCKSQISFGRGGVRYYVYGIISQTIGKDKPDFDIRGEEFRPGGGYTIPQAMAKYDADIEEILSSIPAGADRFTQVYYLNKWLAEHNSYNVKEGGKTPWYAKKSISALEGLSGRDGPVCGGYTSAFKVLCGALDIPCVCVHAIADFVPDHIWNYVQMEDGQWYGIDVTFNDDSDRAENLTKWFLAGAKTEIGGRTFLDSRPAENPSEIPGVADFTNGPALSDAAYPDRLHLSYDGLPEILSPGDAVSMTPVLLGGSDTAYIYSSTALPEGLTLDSDGKITGRIADNADTLTVTVTAANPADSADTASCTLEFPLASSVRYIDVARSDWFYKPVVWATENGVAYGKTETEFGPDDAVTRGQAVTFLWRALGEPEPGNAQNPFEDVVETDYYYKAVLWAVGQEITAGTGPTAFSPKQACSYGHILTFLWRAEGKPNETRKGTWYDDALSWAEGAGVIEPDRAVKEPEEACPRADVVTYLWRELGNSNG